MSLSWGPLVDEKNPWQQEVRWRRPFACACGYIGWEYWNEGRENTLVCTKCGNGRAAEPPTPERTP